MSDKFTMGLQISAGAVVRQGWWFDNHHRVR